MSDTASWKILEALMIELKKKGAAVPSNVLNDLRSAKLMIKISESAGSKGDESLKIEEYLGNVESSLINEAQKILGPEVVDGWLRRLEDARAETKETSIEEENKFITNVPRDQKWIRIEPINNLSNERIQQIAGETSLSANPQKDGRIIVYGRHEDLQNFLKRIAAETTQKTTNKT